MKVTKRETMKALLHAAQVHAPEAWSVDVEKGTGDSTWCVMHEGKEVALATPWYESDDDDDDGLPVQNYDGSQGGERCFAPWPHMHTILALGARYGAAIYWSCVLEAVDELKLREPPAPKVSDARDEIRRMPVAAGPRDATEACLDEAANSIEALTLEVVALRERVSALETPRFADIALLLTESEAVVVRDVLRERAIDSERAGGPFDLALAKMCHAICNRLPSK